MVDADARADTAGGVAAPFDDAAASVLAAPAPVDDDAEAPLADENPPTTNWTFSAAANRIEIQAGSIRNTLDST